MSDTLAVFLIATAALIVWGGAGFALGWRIGRERLALDMLKKAGPRPGKTHLGNTVARNPQQRH